jgi:RNase H-like domain found in reverse transcriptase
MCLLTDASDTHWSGVLTQVPDDQMICLIEDQTHYPLAFGSGAFKGTAERWSRVEKEGFALVESLERFDFLVAGLELILSTDHANLIYIFDPTGQNRGIQRHTSSKLMRWALRLFGYRYTIKHLAGGTNVPADLLTLWTVQPLLCVTRTRVPYIASTTLVHRYIVNSNATPVIHSNQTGITA